MYIKRFNENASDIVFPKVDVLKMMYSEELPDATPHMLKMRYMQDVNNGMLNTKQPPKTMSDTELDRLNDMKKDLSFKVSEIMGATLGKNNDELKALGDKFVTELKSLISEYEHLMPKINPNAKVVDIDSPFKDEEGKIKKFRDPTIEDSSRIKGVNYTDAASTVLQGASTLGNSLSN